MTTGTVNDQVNILPFTAWEVKVLLWFVLLCCCNLYFVSQGVYTKRQFQWSSMKGAADWMAHILWFKMWFTLWFYVSYFLDPLAFSSAALRGFARSEALGQGKTLWTLAPWYFSTDSSWAADSLLQRSWPVRVQTHRKWSAIHGWPCVSISVQPWHGKPFFKHKLIFVRQWDLGTPDIHAMPASWLRTPKEDSCQKWFGVWCQNAWRYSSLILANWLLLPHESAEQICFNFCVHLSFGERCCFVFCFFIVLV